MTQRILAVDDEVHMLRLLERIISEKTPYSIVTTNSSLDVPKLLEEGAFDLVLTDLKMPGIDGLDILRRVKEQGRGEEIVIITAFGSLETAIEALSNDVFDYITKPFKKEQILFTVNKAMRWQRLKREAAAMAALFEPEPYAEAERAFRGRVPAAPRPALRRRSRDDGPTVGPPGRGRRPVPARRGRRAGLRPAPRRKDAMESKRARDLMIPLSEYPHMPYWFTLRQAMATLRSSRIEVDGRVSLPRAFLVFNEAYELLGVVRRRDILRGLEPLFLEQKRKGRLRTLFDVKADPDLLEWGEEGLVSRIRERAERPVGDVMRPIKVTLQHDDHLMKIIYEMVENNLSMIPVLEKGSVVGVVRSVDVLDEVSKLVL